MHWQYGSIEAPAFAGGAAADTRIITLQHASGWNYGQNFFFVDFSHDDTTDGFNDGTAYGEYYGFLSAPKIMKQQQGSGLIKDYGPIFGVNWAPDAKIIKYLPGMRLSWNVPGFAFLNTDLTLYIDNSRGISAGGAPTEEDSYMLDINFSYPFTLGERNRISLEGHVEYISGRDNQFNQRVENWLLAQPQLRYDLGQRLWQAPDQLFVGVEWQYWRNKLGDDATDESQLLLLVVWRF